MNFETMSTQRKMILIASAVGVIAMFLPWVSTILGSGNGMHGGGIIAFICFLAAGFLSFTGDQTTNLNRMNWMLTLIAGGVALIVTVINFFDIPSVVRGYGVYIAMAASIAVLAFAWMHKSATDSLQGGFDTLKNSFNNNATTTQTGTTTTTTTSPTTTVTHTPTNDTTRPTV